MFDIVYFGTSANPITYSHLKLAEWATHHGKHVHVGICAKHAFGKELVPFDHRVAMAKLLFQSDPHVTVSTLEHDIWSTRPDMPVYSFDVATALIEKYKTTNIALCVGPDVALNLHAFYKGMELLEKVSVLVAPGHVAPQDTRSTYIRKHVAAGEYSAASTLTSPSVVQYIQDHNLYQ